MSLVVVNLGLPKSGTTTLARAPGMRLIHWPISRSGQLSDGRPAGISPMTSTPCSVSCRAETMMMARNVTSSAAGMRGITRSRANRKARLPNPITTVAMTA